MNILNILHVLSYSIRTRTVLGIFPVICRGNQIRKNVLNSYVRQILFICISNFLCLCLENTSWICVERSLKFANTIVSLFSFLLIKVTQTQKLYTAICRHWLLRSIMNVIIQRPGLFPTFFLSILLFLKRALCQMMRRLLSCVPLRFQTPHFQPGGLPRGCRKFS